MKPVEIAVYITPIFVYVEIRWFRDNLFDKFFRLSTKRANLNVGLALFR